MIIMLENVIRPKWNTNIKYEPNDIKLSRKED